MVLNLTPVPRNSYRIAVPKPGRYARRLSSDEPRFGGSQFDTYEIVQTEAIGAHVHAQSVNLRLPLLGALVLKLEE